MVRRTGLAVAEDNLVRRGLVRPPRVDVVERPIIQTKEEVADGADVRGPARSELVAWQPHLLFQRLVELIPGVAQ